MKRFQEGLFDEYKIKSTHKKVIPKKTYLPNYDKAIAFNPPVFEGSELWQSTYETLVFDIEIYPNYFLVAFKSIDSGKCIYFEKTEKQELDCATIKWIIENYLIVGFNSYSFDVPILSLALSGASLKILNDATRKIIVYQERAYNVLKEYKCKMLKPNHIDLIEVCPLSGSLKIYGARLHTKQLADLPFNVDAKLTSEQITIVRWYCFNDLQCTEDIFKFLKKDIELRESLGEQYGIDLRSKSDAQIAETVIGKELYKLSGKKPQKEEFPSFYACSYDPPNYLNFKTSILQNVKSIIEKSKFNLDFQGSVIIPDEVKELKFTIGQTTYQIGGGGLHSTESNKAWFCDENHRLIDRDVASYYPFIVLNNELYPEHLGKDFLDVYRTLVDRRLKAKRSKDKRTADSLKITINGTFGKLGSSFSILYSPKLLIQVTITGQLSLLYLIEKIELKGISVISANTDGVVIKCPKNRKDELDSIIKEWELETNFETEETEYFCLASVSVNDYMAVKTDLECKSKGQKLGWGITKLFKNPTNGICITAIENLLSKSIPIDITIRECKDITQFISVRKVTGGGIKDEEYLGKVVRFYYSTETDTPIVYAKSGNKVNLSEGARPCMTLPDRFPDDVDIEHYIRLTKQMLGEMGLKL
jgi:hypothetical protein